MGTVTACHDSWHQIGWLIMWWVRWPVTDLFLCLFVFVYICLVTWPFLETVYSSHTEGTYFPQLEYQLWLPRKLLMKPWSSDWGASTQAEPKSGWLETSFHALGAWLLHIHQKHNSCTWLLVTKMPISKFLKTQFSGPKTEQEAMPGILSHCLFHECMRWVLAPLWLDQRQYYESQA